MSDCACVLDSVSVEASALPAPRVQTPLMPSAPTVLTATAPAEEPFDALLADLLEGIAVKLTDAPGEVAAEPDTECSEVPPSDVPALLASLAGLDPMLALLSAPGVERPTDSPIGEAPDRQVAYPAAPTAAQPHSDGPIANAPAAHWDALSTLSETPAPPDAPVIPHAPRLDSDALGASVSDDDPVADAPSAPAVETEVSSTHQALPNHARHVEPQVLHTDVQPSATASTQPSHEVSITSVRWVERLADGTGRLELSLHPSHLGRVEVIIASDGSSVSATLLSPDRAVCAVLRTQLEALHTALLSAGIAVGELNVGLGASERHDAPPPRPAGRGRSAAGAPAYAPDAPVVRQYRALHGLAIDVFV